MGTVTDETLPKYLEKAKRCGADRIFIGGMGLVYSKSSRIYTEYDKVKATVEYFRSNGFEVGIWITTLGNGHCLTLSGRTDEKFDFTQITGIGGESQSAYSNCPLDKNFIEACKSGVRRIASIGSDLIMIDDDLRFYSRRGVRFPCFCPLHLREYYKKLGEEIPREKLEKLILTGGENKYRTSLLEVFEESILGFARALREAVDEVNPKIRLGQCTFETWDMFGADPISISKALAGNTPPFARISGAPFSNANVLPIIEYSRQQYAWGKGSGVELFSEGDIYPRSRGNVNSRHLEIFELIMSADGTSDGMLAYLFDYFSYPDYEPKYVERYCRNAKIRGELREIFEGKRSIGVEVVGVAHKAQRWQLPEELEQQSLDMMLAAVKPASVDLLAPNSIPSTFEEQSDYPLLVIGENARHVSLERLSQGAIIDIPAARILQERGVDTGLISAHMEEMEKECFDKYGDFVGVFGPITKRESFYSIECSERAEIRSTFAPKGTPASYRYENANGQRFMVLAYDHFKSIVKGKVTVFTSGHYRKAELIEAAEWLSGKKIPAVTTKCPNLYMLASKGENALSVALANVSIDEALDPVVELDKNYSEIRFVNCSGRLEGDKVYLSDIAAYGLCAFEVK